MKLIFKWDRAWNGALLGGFRILITSPCDDSNYGYLHFHLLFLNDLIALYLNIGGRS